MRCLYCGKRLPLLKKLLSGTAFCSDAHRRKYREEYNRIVLDRLRASETPATAPPLAAPAPAPPVSSQPAASARPDAAPQNGAPPEPFGFLPERIEPRSMEASPIGAEVGPLFPANLPHSQTGPLAVLADAVAALQPALDALPHMPPGGGIPESGASVQDLSSDK